MNNIYYLLVNILFKGIVNISELGNQRFSTIDYTEE